MKHTIVHDESDPLVAAMAKAIETCVHCGFCLPTCPTYVALGQEMDSPRGRIVLMKQVLEGRLPITEVTRQIDQCLGCVACETSCPSKVKYGDLISPFRVTIEPNRRRSFMDRMKRLIISQTLPYPWRFRAALKAAGLGRMFRPLLFRALQPMLDLIPPELPARVKLQEVYRTQGTPRARVALLAGCAQQVLAPQINQATIDVLLANQVEVLVPKSQSCCGALAWHIGDAKSAARLGARNLKAFPTSVDAIVTNAAGCGSGLRDYELIFRGSRWEEAANRFVEKVCDVSRFLFDLGFDPPPPLMRPLKVAYHDACHLGHAQAVRMQPRQLLRSIGNLEMLEIADCDLCCGSAGTYNIDQPQIAADLGRRKAARVAQTGCDVVATGNIGCMVQLQKYLAEQRPEIRVKHTMEVIADAYFSARSGKS